MVQEGRHSKLSRAGSTTDGKEVRRDPIFRAGGRFSAPQSFPILWRFGGNVILSKAIGFQAWPGSSHAAAPDREKDKSSGQRENQQYERGCDDGNLGTRLLPSWNAKEQTRKCGDEQDCDNESEQ